jgi:hypothetical protein
MIEAGRRSGAPPERLRPPARAGWAKVGRSAGLFLGRALVDLELFELIALDRIEDPSVLAVGLGDDDLLAIDQSFGHAAIEADLAVVIPAQLRRQVFLPAGLRRGCQRDQECSRADQPGAKPPARRRWFNARSVSRQAARILRFLLIASGT